MYASHSARRAAPSLVDGEFAFTAEDLRFIAAIVHEQSGIVLSDAKAALVYSRLAKRLRVLGLRSFGEYRSRLADERGTERREMLAALTTNVTRFFREPHHFEHLKTRVLPPLLQKAREGGRIRLWSSACSSGQEPYSMALTLLSVMPEAGRYDIRILATDIDPNMVAQGREGCYGDSDIAGVPAPSRRWFIAAASDSSKRWQVCDELRRLVTFRELNLIGDYPMKGRFDAIFCRNAVIYFDDATQVTVWARLTRMLTAGGALYIGHSERVTGDAQAFLRPDGVTTYRHHQAAGSP